MDRLASALPRKREKQEEEFEDQDLQLAMLAYVPVLGLVSLILRKRSRFVAFHLRQGLVLFVLELMSGMVYFIPLVGWQLSLVLATACFVTALRGVFKARAGGLWEAPLVAAVVAIFHR